MYFEYFLHHQWLNTQHLPSLLPRDSSSSGINSTSMVYIEKLTWPICFHLLVKGFVLWILILNWKVLTTGAGILVGRPKLGPVIIWFGPSSHRTICWFLTIHHFRDIILSDGRAKVRRHDPDPSCPRLANFGFDWSQFPRALISPSAPSLSPFSRKYWVVIDVIIFGWSPYSLIRNPELMPVDHGMSRLTGVYPLFFPFAEIKDSSVRMFGQTLYFFLYVWSNHHFNNFYA